MSDCVVCTKKVYPFIGTGHVSHCGTKEVGIALKEQLSVSNGHRARGRKCGAVFAV